MPAASARRKELHDKDRDFALALIEHKFNGKQAAIAVGYAERSAASAASTLLTKAKVQELINAELEKLRERQQITIQDMYEEWRRIAFANMQDYTLQADDGETYISLPHGDRAKMAAVKKVKTFETTDEDGNVTRRVEIELFDKVNGMDKLSRLFGMFEGKDAPITVLNANGPVTVNNNTQINQTNVVVTPQDAAEEYRKLIGR